MGAGLFEQVFFQGRSEWLTYYPQVAANREQVFFRFTVFQISNAVFESGAQYDVSISNFTSSSLRTRS